MRWRPWSVVLSVVVVLCLVPPAVAARSDWDPNDRPGVLDLRWGGLTVQDRDTIRLGISLWNRVYPRHVRAEDEWIRVTFWSNDLAGEIAPTRHGWSLWLSYQGVYWDRKLKVTHPKPTVFRVWIDEELLADDGMVEVWTRDVVGGRPYKDRITPLSL